MSAPRTFFRHNPADAWLVLAGVSIVVTLAVTLVWFHTLPWWVLAAAFTYLMWSYCWNLQCISHNFIHNPYFTSETLNRAFGLLETVALGVPHILYHHYHLNHHFGDNDKKGPDGKTRDWSSIYRYGTNDEPEAFWRYCLVSFWRVELGPVVRKVYLHGPSHVAQLVAESVILAAFWLTMMAVDWRYFVIFYLPSYYLGWMLSYAEGYLEHFRCEPGNHFANSVSSYHKLYNWLWFNNGYHQEHHWDPKCHWTRMEHLRRAIEPQMKANGTRVLKGPHLTAFIEDWVNEKWGRPPEQPARRAA